MITGIIAAVFILATLCCMGDGAWGSVAVGVVIVVIILALGSAGRKSNKAYNNFVDYWADGGPDKKK